MLADPRSLASFPGSKPLAKVVLVRVIGLDLT